MLAAGEHRKHGSGMLLIARFAEKLAVAFRHGVASDDQRRAGPRGNIKRLLIGEPCDQLRRRFAAANAAFGRFRRNEHVEMVAMLGEQLLAPRRTGGQRQLSSKHGHNHSRLRE